MDYFHRTLRWFAELLWPARCLGCSAFGASLCRTCLKTIPTRKYQECLVCKRPSLYGQPCSHCRSHTMVDRLAIAGSADHPLLKEAIHTLKYKYTEDLAAALADWMVSAVARHKMLPGESSPLFVPVPLHPRRLRERGFNQADLLARRVAAILAMSYELQALERIRYTSSQVKSRSRWERLENMTGAFHCAQPELVVDRDIILVDDVCTTGATLDACARALKESGARTVSAFVLARG